MAFSFFCRFVQQMTRSLFSPIRTYPLQLSLVQFPRFRLSVLLDGLVPRSANQSYYYSLKTDTDNSACKTACFALKCSFKKSLFILLVSSRKINTNHNTYISARNKCIIIYRLTFLVHLKNIHSIINTSITRNIQK
ncbi:Hypothetical_protein [Hexamita inflata]|uniref:Hypothetical_protein n=1 Tax=Hexamita inflata TaxID=28002 RepID=A0AA86QXI8_9EUKA|nr:Hypothetical protein HINF_LOCUS54050 [Hexamita inflata]